MAQEKPESKKLVPIEPDVKLIRLDDLEQFTNQKDGRQRLDLVISLFNTTVGTAAGIVLKTYQTAKELELELIETYHEYEQKKEEKNPHAQLERKLNHARKLVDSYHSAVKKAERDFEHDFTSAEMFKAIAFKVLNDTVNKEFGFSLTLKSGSVNILLPKNEDSD